MPKKSTDTDMTPFVDVAFLILTFFILATKFKPPEPLPITTPKSVSSQKLEEKDAVMIQFDSAGRVYLSVNVTKKDDEVLKKDFITRVSLFKDNHPEVTVAKFAPITVATDSLSVLAVSIQISNAEQRTDSVRRALRS